MIACFAGEFVTAFIFAKMSSAAPADTCGSALSGRPSSAQASIRCCSTRSPSMARASSRLCTRRRSCPRNGWPRLAPKCRPAGDLQDRHRAQPRRARGLLRPRHRLQSVHAESLRTIGATRPGSRMGRSSPACLPAQARGCWLSAIHGCRTPFHAAFRAASMPLQTAPNQTTAA